MSVQECAGVYRSVQECAGVYRSVQECAGVCRSVQECTGVLLALLAAGGLASLSLSLTCGRGYGSSTTKRTHPLATALPTRILWEEGSCI